MKRDTVNYFWVGIVVLSALTLLIATLFAVSGRGGKVDRYWVSYLNVSGLGYGSAVFYQGYRIGQVEAITPEQKAGKTRFRVDFSVTQGWQIPAASTASLMSSGLLSDVFIGVSEGPGPNLLAAGSELTGREGADIFAAVSALAGEVTHLTQHKIAPLLEKVGTSVDSIANELEAGAPAIVEDTVRLLKRLNVSADAVNEVLGPGNRKNVEQLLAQSSDTARNARQLSADLLKTRAELDRMLKTLDQTVSSVSPDISASMADLRTTLSTLAQRVDAITYNLESASRHFDEFGRELRRQPNRLIFSTNQDDNVKDSK